MQTKKLLMIFCASIFFHCSRGVNNDVAKDIAIGSAAGVAEVAVDQPLVYFKNMVQQGKRISLHPEMWWRGAGVNAASLAPVTAIQVAGNNAILKALKRDNAQHSGAEKIVAAYTAGALSGMVSCPSENVMLHQQNTGNNLYNTTRSMMKTYGMRGMYRSLAPTMLRDGGFTAGYLGLRPILRKQLENYTANETVLTLAPGISSGLVAGVITHPFDTVKTKMQAALNEPEAASTFKMLAQVYRNESFKGLFKGLGARSTRVASAITIMGYVTDKLSALLKKE